MEILTIPNANEVSNLLSRMSSNIIGFVDTLKSGVVKVAKGVKNKIVDKVKSFSWKEVKTKVKESVKGVKKFVGNVSVLGYEKLKTFLYDTGISLSERQLDDLDKLQEINNLNEDKITEMPKNDLGKVIENASGLENMEELITIIMNVLVAKGIIPNGQMPQLNGEQQVVVANQVIPVKPEVVQEAKPQEINPSEIKPEEVKPQEAKPKDIKPDQIPQGTYREIQAFMAGFNAAIRYAMKNPSIEMPHSMGTNIPEMNNEELEEDPTKLNPVEPETSIPEVKEEIIQEEKSELYQPLGQQQEAPAKVTIISKAVSAIKNVPANIKERLLNALERGFTTVNIKSSSNKERTAEVTKQLTMEERIEIQRSKNTEKLETYRELRNQIRETQEEMMRQSEMEQMQMNEEGPVLSRGFITPGSLWIFMGILGSILEFGALFLFFLFRK